MNIRIKHIVLDRLRKRPLPTSLFVFETDFSSGNEIKAVIDCKLTINNVLLNSLYNSVKFGEFYIKKSMSSHQ